MVPSTQCGERLRRTESYTNKVIGRQPNGKLDLDVGRIRQRQRDVGLSGSVYTPPGPHHFQTDHPGLGQSNTVEGCARDEGLSYDACTNCCLLS